LGTNGQIKYNVNWAQSERRWIMQRKFTRREFLKATGYAASSIALTGCGRQMLGDTALPSPAKAEMPVVSVVRIKNDNIDYAVRESIDLLGGINNVTAN
jgi:hypothetical protein